MKNGTEFLTDQMRAGIGASASLQPLEFESLKAWKEPVENSGTSSLQSWANPKMRESKAAPQDVICLSHLRWNFVFQRPQHLLTRIVENRRVFFFEEPIIVSGEPPYLDIQNHKDGVRIAVPHLPEGLSPEETHALQRSLLDQLLKEHGIKDFLLWYYTPMALNFSRHLNANAVVYDCMDELSAFRFAPSELRIRELELFQRADVVFTGGQSLYEVKKHQHSNVHAFPSSVDFSHFALARNNKTEPSDQAHIPYPRVGFFGVIDERMDLELLKGVAEAKPDLQFIILGPVVKIDPATLPALPNVHYLGSKSYQELPSYLAGWDVALLPFAKNESTKFISPTKTPEYLAAGKPVVSTSIRDVVRPYQELGLVQIADDVPSFVKGIELALDKTVHDENWLARVDAFLARNSWDQTWKQMDSLINRILKQPKPSAVQHSKM